MAISYFSPVTGLFRKVYVVTSISRNILKIRVRVRVRISSRVAVNIRVSIMVRVSIFL